MAVKYFYNAGGGSVTWATAGIWFNGSGGTGGGTTSPVAADDVILDINSNGGTLVPATNQTVNSLNMEGFTGNLGGTGAFIIKTDVAPPSNYGFKGGGTITNTATLTFSGVYSGFLIKSNGITFPTGVTFNNTSLNCTFVDDFKCVGTFTLTTGTITSAFDIYCAAIGSNSTTSRNLTCNILHLQGSGTIGNLANTGSITFNNSIVYIDGNTSLARTFTLPSAYTTPLTVYATGVGSGDININIGTTKSDVIVNNTGGANVSFLGTYNKISFLSGTNAIWNNTSSSSMTIDAVSIGATSGIFSDAGVPTFILTPAILVNNTTGGSVNQRLSISGNSITTNVTVNTDLIIENNTNIIGILTLNSSTSTITIQNSSNMNLNSMSLSTGTINISNTNLTISGSVSITTGIFSFNGSGNTYAISVGSLVSNNNNVRSILFTGGILSVTGSGTVWNAQGTNLTFTAPNIMYLANTTTNTMTLALGSQIFKDFTISRGSSTGSISITGSNTFDTFRDNGTATHSIVFTNGTTQTFKNFVVNGNPGNLVTINSSNTTTHNLVKSTPGIIKCSYLNIQHSVATPPNTWYAGVNSVNNQGVVSVGSGWLFTNPTPMMLARGYGYSY